MATILIQANAKINLDLKILGKRPDGFHQIESVFQSIDLSDFLLFEKSKKDNLTGAIICLKAENIILLDNFFIVYIILYLIFFKDKSIVVIPG